MTQHSCALTSRTDEYHVWISNTGSQKHSNHYHNNRLHSVRSWSVSMRRKTWLKCIILTKILDVHWMILACEQDVSYPVVLNLGPLALDSSTLTSNLITLNIKSIYSLCIRAKIHFLSAVPVSGRSKELWHQDCFTIKENSLRVTLWQKVEKVLSF